MSLRLSGVMVLYAITFTLNVRAETAGTAGVTSIEKEATLDTVLRVALEHNPTLAEARARLTASRERIDASGQRPDPELRYEQWSVPLAQPLSLNHANMVMVGVQQTFPAPGSLTARRQVAAHDAQIVTADLRTRELELAAQVKRAYAEYVRADAEFHIHQQHVDLTHRLSEVARVQYASNRIAQEEVLRTSVEASRIHSDLLSVEQERKSSAALLNVLMGRPADAPLGQPKPVTATVAMTQVAELKQKLTPQRPEIAAAESAVHRSTAALQATRAESKWPMLMVGLDYVYDPMMPQHGYSAMLGMTLPWLNSGRRAEVRAAEADVLAQQQSLESVKLTTQFQLLDAAARVESAQKALAILDDSVLPQVQRGFEASRASFVSGGGSTLGVLDSLRTLLQIQVDRTRAQARLAASIAELERAAGLAIPSFDPSRS